LGSKLGWPKEGKEGEKSQKPNSDFSFLSPFSAKIQAALGGASKLGWLKEGKEGEKARNRILIFHFFPLFRRRFRLLWEVLPSMAGRKKAKKEKKPETEF